MPSKPHPTDPNYDDEMKRQGYTDTKKEPAKPQSEPDKSQTRTRKTTTK